MTATRSKKRTTTRKTRTSNYKSYTPTKLIAAARKWQKKLEAFSKSTAKKKINGKTISAHKVAVQKEFKKIATYLNSATTKKISAKIKALKTQMAKHHKVKPTSRKATSPAVKSLTLKYKQFKKSGNNLFSLIKLHTGLKLNSFKNPIAKKKKVKKTATRTVKKTAVKRTAKRRATTKSLITSKVTTTKSKTQAKVLKKEISNLKKRNVSLRKLVAKFRKEVEQLQRHYGASKPRLTLVHSKQVGQDVNNIVRFSNALSNAVTKQRKVG